VHTLKLEINESIYSQVLAFLDQFRGDEISIVEDEKQENFLVSSVDEVRERILKAEQNGQYISADTFWTEIDKKIEAM
jgi:hypothetical protein